VRIEKHYRHLNNGENKELRELLTQMSECSRGCGKAFPELTDSDAFCEECDSKIDRIRELVNRGGKRLSGGKA